MKAHEHYSQLVLQFADSQGAYTAVRHAAAEALSHTVFPTYRSEDYQRTDPELFLTDLPAVQTSGHEVSDVYSRPQGNFYSGSLLGFLEQYPTVADRYYGHIATSNTDAFVHLNTAMVTDGYVLYVGQGCQLTEPIHLSFSSSTSNTASPTINLRRILIVMERHAQASLIIEDKGEEAGSVAMQVCEIAAAAGSRIHICESESSGSQSRRISSTHIKQCADSSVSVLGLTLSNGISRNNYYAHLAEPGAEVILKGLALAVKGRHTDNFSRIKHDAPHCHTEEIFKYIIGDDAVGAFSGLIYVDQKAQKTTAYQNNRNLILSPSGKMYGKPQLEIYADDVKCSHGMTTGQIDEQALFYLRARGIPATEAKRMLTIAFADEIVKDIQPETYRQKLIDTVSAEL